MSDKTHCDLCDAVIDPDVQHLVLTVGLWEGDQGTDEEQHRDFCRTCSDKHEVLKALFDEQMADYMEALSASGSAQHRDPKVTR